MRAKIIAVDFDGTLIEEGKWPDIGATNEKVLNYCKQEQLNGTRIILWTNRTKEPLAKAVKWCEEHGLHLDAVNDNIQESVDFFGFNTRKIYADEFIDDRMKAGFNLPYKENDSELVPLQQVLDDMYNPDGGYAAMAARDYYYQHYATADEKKKMNREDKIKMFFAVIFLVLVGFAIITAVI